MDEIQFPQKGNEKVNKLEAPRRVFFFERADGSIIVTSNGSEAWNILRGRNQVLNQERTKMKFVGSSDGKIFYQAVREAHDIFRKERNIEKAQERIRKGEADELEIARGQMVYPMNHDAVTQGGIPVDLNTFGRV